jgi:hypothetical protein
VFSACGLPVAAGRDGCGGGFQSVIEDLWCAEDIDREFADLKRPQLLRIGQLHAAVLRLPLEECPVADPVMAAQVLGRSARLVLLQNLDDLFLCKTALALPERSPDDLSGMTVEQILNRGRRKKLATDNEEGSICERLPEA